MNFEPGSKIGDYEVLGTLGAGGMGRVYKVRNDLSDRVEAMKILLPDLEGNADLANRFLREIKTQAGLDHPNIAKLYTALRIENQLLMCMELVEGITLDERLKTPPPIPLVDAVDYIVQVLDALEYAHQRGVVHRDIKPANMMLMPGGRLKLLDFGIAKATVDTRLTVTGTTLGSLYYMSPEQIQGSQVDVRSDIYSVGVSLYEAVTGKKPFDAESQFAIMSAHLARPPVPPVQLNASLPPAVSEIILVALAKEPKDRFQTAGAFLNALRNVQQEVGFGAGTAPSAPATGLRMTAMPSPPPPSRVFVPGSAAPLGDSLRNMTAMQGTPAPVQQAQPHLIEPTAAAPKKSGPRLMWVAVGSLCAVGAIVAFIQFGPKGQTSAKETTPASAVKVGQAPAAGSTPTLQNTPAKPSAMPTAAQPAGSADSRKQTPAQRAQARIPAQQASPQQQQSAPPAAAPAETPQAQPQSAPAPGGGPQPGMINADRVEVQRLRDRLDLMYARARTVRSALADLQNQQSAQGVGARSDWVEAFNRMNMFLKQSTAAINDGNPTAATEAMAKAERELEILEKALGR